MWARFDALNLPSRPIALCDIRALRAQCAQISRSVPDPSARPRAVFLGLNGKELDATEAEVVQVMTALAAGILKEPQLAAWVRDHLICLKR